MRLFVRILLLIAGSALHLALPPTMHSAWAGASAPHAAEAVTARLVSAQDAVTPDAGTLSAGLDLKLARGWKTYWRSPGEVGLAPQLDWSRSGNVADVELLYPAPTRFTAFGIENYGYRDRVVYPLRVELERPGEAARLNLDATILVCAEICVPETFTLGLDVPAGATAALDGDGAALIARFAERVPTADDRSVEVERVAHDKDAGRYVVTVRADGPLNDPQVFLEIAGAKFGAPEEPVVTEGGRRVRIAVPVSVEGYGPDLAIVTVADGKRAVEHEVEIDTDTADYSLLLFIRIDSFLDTLGFLGLAFLGGLILNLMPCVLPVLSIKLAGALSMRAGSDGGDPARIRRGFLWSAAGVMSFALGLAAVLIGLRASGVAVGWGMQFQNPFFLTFVVAVLGLFALSMLDVVHLDLPASWNRRMALAGGPGVEGKGHAGDFLAGAFAALLATPCSAPFLGTAVAFALASGAAETAAVFAALGLGLALPYLVVAARPSLVRRLPRPGPWMAWLRRVLALALAVTAAWLLTVLAANVGWPAALAVAGLIGLAMALLVAPLDRRLRMGTAAAAVMAAFVAPAVLASSPAPPASAAAADHVWVEFDRSSIPERVARGETVFVDVTADWCLTCKVNKRLVLSAPPVRERLSAITAMRADWTRPDGAILDYLRSKGRYGIPFNAVYGPGAPEGIMLSELLTSEAVLAAIDRARGT